MKKTGNNRHSLVDQTFRIFSFRIRLFTKILLKINFYGFNKNESMSIIVKLDKKMIKNKMK